MGRQYIEPPVVSPSTPLLLTRFLRRLQVPRLPTECVICRGWDRHRVCAACRQRFVSLVPRCLRCAVRVPTGVSECGACVKHPPPYDAALAALDYAHPWDRLIAAFKFRAALDLAMPLAQSMADAWRASGEPEPGWLVPVPLSAPRLRERGYNQSWEITRRLGRLLERPADAQLLLRIKDTPHQLAFPPERRAANVHGAFAVEPSRIASLGGRTLTVLDDVMTTGATAAEIARVLKQAGAARVQIWVLARTPSHRD
jgi:ComF family protein